MTIPKGSMHIVKGHTAPGAQCLQLIVVDTDDILNEPPPSPSLVLLSLELSHLISGSKRASPQLSSLSHSLKIVRMSHFICVIKHALVLVSETNLSSLTHHRINIDSTTSFDGFLTFVNHCMPRIGRDRFCGPHFYS